MSKPDNMKYKDLTPEQKRVICNGCGGKGSIIPVPEFIFNASCDHHDFEYWRGGTEVDRKKTDRDFYYWMNEDVRNAPWYKRPYYYSWAWTYYKFVRLKGGNYYHYTLTKRSFKDAKETFLNE